MSAAVQRAERLPRWARWILLLPASIAAYLLLHVAVVMGGKILIFFQAQGGWGQNFFQYLVAPAVAGYWAIAFPASFAPARPRRTSFVLCCVWMVIYGVSAGATLFAGDWKTLLPVIVSAYCSGAALAGLDPDEASERPVPALPAA